MSHGKRRFRAFGLALLAALGLVVFMAAGAQANWLYLEGGKTFELTSNESVKVGKDSDFTFLIEGQNIKFLCQTITTDVNNVVNLEPGKATTANASGKILINECVAIEKSSGDPVEDCDPINQPIQAAGKAHIILHTNGQNYVLFEPNVGQPFATIEIDELCSLTETTNVSGSFVAECGALNGSSVFVQEDCKNHLAKHFLRPAPESLFPSDLLKYGARKASIDGIATAELDGIAHAGQAWSGEV